MLKLKNTEARKRIVLRKRWIFLGLLIFTFVLQCLFLDVAYGSLFEISIWEFDTNFNDSTANNNDWSNVSVDIVPGLFGNASYFNATGDYLFQSSSASLNTTAQNGFTYETWINITNMTGSYVNLMGNRRDADYSGFRAMITDTGFLYCNFEGFNDTGVIGDTNLTNVYYNQWVNLMCIYDPTTATIGAYVNGILDAQDPVDTGPLALSTWEWAGGVKPDTHTAQFYGLIDRTRIINSSLPIYHLVVTAYFEENGTTITPFDITVFNSTYSLSYNDANPFFMNWTYYLPTGSLEVQASNDVFPTRHYYLDFYDSTVDTLNVYLLESHEGAYVRFHVQNSGGDQLPNALVTAQKQYGTEWITIAQGKTDDTGTATLFLNPTATYKIIISYTGYVSQELTIIPSSSDYTITLTSTTDLRYINLFDDISYRLVPLSLAVSSQDWVNFSVYSFNSTLEYWGLNITYINGTCINCQISDTAGGGTFNGNFSLDGIDRIVAYYYFKRATYSEWGNQRTFYVHNITAGQFSIFSIFGLQMADSEIIPPFVRDIVVLTVITIASLPFGAVSPMGAGFMAIVGLGFVTLMGWFSANLFILLLLALGGMVVLAGLGK